MYTNDIAKGRHTNVHLDMSANSFWSVDDLLALAGTVCFPCSDPSKRIADHGSVIGWLNAEKIATLFHCSTPCDTYSIAGLQSHRVGKTLEPKTETAHEHDIMNELLVNYFISTVLSPPPAPTPAPTPAPPNPPALQSKSGSNLD